MRKYADGSSDPNVVFGFSLFAVESYNEVKGFGTGILEIMKMPLGYKDYIPGVYLECFQFSLGRKYRHLRFAADAVVKFPGVGMPVRFAHATRVEGDGIKGAFLSFEDGKFMGGSAFKLAAGKAFGLAGFEVEQVFAHKDSDRFVD